MLQVRDITKRFGDVLVLDRINFNLNRGERAGLIGPNGCGKTTLLRIVTGEIAADRGTVQLAPASLRAGYLPQALDWPAGATVGDVLRAAQGEREAAEGRLARLAEALAAAQGDALAAALDEYDRALAEYQALGGERLRADADAVLAGLGMADVDQDRPVRALSGGQKTRLGLARLLLTEPDLLLLDEPTNHLDISALAWLEEYLADYPGAVLIISHDRAFLDRTVTRILALDDVTHRLKRVRRQLHGLRADSRSRAGQTMGDLPRTASARGPTRSLDHEAGQQGQGHREGDDRLPLSQNRQGSGPPRHRPEAPAGAHVGERGDGRQARPGLEDEAGVRLTRRAAARTCSLSQT